MPVCFLFLQLPEQGVSGSARLYHTGDSTVDVTSMAREERREKTGLGNGDDSDAHLINQNAKSDLFQTKQKF